MTEPVREESRLAQSIAARWRRWRGVSIAGAVVVASMFSLAALHRPSGPDSRFAVVEQQPEPPAAAPDPLTAELIRCGSLPLEIDDPACRAAWEENRRRFFGESGATNVPGEPLPIDAKIPVPGAAPAEGR